MFKLWCRHNPVVGHLLSALVPLMQRIDWYIADQIENRTVVLRNLPENVTDEQLKELFPDAPNFLLARDKDHKPKG